MHWEYGTALSYLRDSDLLLSSVASIRDCADLIKVWNILFVRLINPLFQLGNPSIRAFPILHTLPGLRNALRPLDISDLLITITHGSTRFPPDSHSYLLIRWAFDVHLLRGVSISRHDEEATSDEDGRFLYHGLELNLIEMSWLLAGHFTLAGVGRQSGGHFTHYRLRL